MANNEKLILLSDHDGTMTDSEREAEEYGHIVREFISENTGVSEEEVSILLAEAHEEIAKKPDIFGWKVGDVVVAPALADHYVSNTVATRIVLERLVRSSDVFKRYDDQTEAENFVGKLFRECSPKLGVFYRDGVEQYIKFMKMSGDFKVITNSDPNVVKSKMTKYLGDVVEGIPVVGNAKKYAVDLDWKGVVPEGSYKGFAGFPERGVNLQRRIYHTTLMDITSGDISRARMVGDIAELDLLMIDYLGGRTALILSDISSSWEVNYYQTGERRFASRNLNSIADWIVRD